MVNNSLNRNLYKIFTLQNISYFIEFLSHTYAIINHQRSLIIGNIYKLIIIEIFIIPFI